MNKRFNQIIEEFEAGLRAFFDAKKELYPEELYDAMEYSLFSGGKRIRPLIMRLSADFLGISRSKISDFAIALELIHTYSLIHDDLPSMDNDDLRRGKPTCHKVFGEALAILAGDALLNIAYETMLKAVSLDNKLFCSALIISECAGASGMIGGQVEDITMYAATEEQVLAMYSKKTAALIKAATLAPCYLHKNEAAYNDMQIFGEKLGILFQLTDDMLDNDKNSYPVLFGSDRAKELIYRLFNDINELLLPYGDKSESLLDLTKSVVCRQK